MAIGIPRGERDSALDQIVDALAAYERDHPAAQIDVYRQNAVSIRIRIIDASFQRLEKSARHDAVWQYLDSLPEETQSDISMLVLVSPDEKRGSFSNLEFEDPVPSKL